MDGLGGHYASSETNQKENNKHCISLISGIRKIQQTSEYNKRKQTQIHRIN